MISCGVTVPVNAIFTWYYSVFILILVFYKMKFKICLEFSFKALLGVKVCCFFRFLVLIV